jgi:hypothetical protein
VAPCCCAHSILNLSTKTLLPRPTCFVLRRSTVKEIVGLLHQDGARSVSLVVPGNEVRRGAGVGRSQCHGSRQRQTPVLAHSCCGPSCRPHVDPSGID